MVNNYLIIQTPHFTKSIFDLTFKDLMLIEGMNIGIN